MYAYECSGGNSQVFMQTASSVHRHAAAPITLSAHSSTYPAVSCSRYFSSSFRRRRDTWKRCAALAHTPSTSFVYTSRMYSQRAFASSPSPRIDADVFFSSLPLAVVPLARVALLFFRHCTYELRFLRDRINHATFERLSRQTTNIRKRFFDVARLDKQDLCYPILRFY